VWQAIGQMLPITVAAAVSSVPIMAMILVLLSPRRTQSAVPFLVGWVLGIAAVVSLCALGARATPTSRGNQPDVALGIMEMLVGGALILVAVASWRRARHRAALPMPRWLRAIGSLGGWSSFGVAFVLNLRPKGLLLALAAGLVLRGANLPLADAVIAIAIYTIVAASTIVVPIVMTLAAPQRMEGKLVSARDWMESHHTVVSSTILVMIGVVAIGNGLARL
jgi:hypothetical protein